MSDGPHGVDIKILNKHVNIFFPLLKTVTLDPRPNELGSRQGGYLVRDFFLKSKWFIECNQKPIYKHTYLQQQQHKTQCARD